MSQWVSVNNQKPKCEEEVFVRVKHETYGRNEPYYVTT